MTQQVKPRSVQTLDATFQQKSTGLSLVIIASAAAYFAAKIWAMRPAAGAANAIPAGYGSLVIGTLALIIGAQIVLQIVLVIGAGSAPEATAAEKAGALKARRNAYFVLAAGVIAAAAAFLILEPGGFYTANIAVLSLVVAEIVHLASQLVYARRG